MTRGLIRGRLSRNLERRWRTRRQRPTIDRRAHYRRGCLGLHRGPTGVSPCRRGVAALLNMVRRIVY